MPGTLKRVQRDQLAMTDRVWVVVLTATCMAPARGSTIQTLTDRMCEFESARFRFTQDMAGICRETDAD